MDNPTSEAATTTFPNGEPAGNRRWQVEQMVAMINEVTAPLTGGDYFRALVARLAENLDVHAALATECLEYPENHVRTLAFWEGEGITENIEFDLVGTPCEEVIHGGAFCFYPDDLSKQFPDWAAEEGGIESFIGIPVLAPSDGRTLGHIAVYGRKPMAEDAVVESMFRIIAARAGAEIERLQAERALRDSEARARQHLTELAHVSRLGSMGELASALAHEVNQPLTAIMTYCRTCLRMLEQGRLSEADLHQAMSNSLASAEHAREVVSKLRSFIRRGEMKPHPVPAAHLLRECRVLLDTEARHHHVRLRIVAPEDLPTVRVDSVLIQQVIFNLVRNGIEAINDSDNPRRELSVTLSAEGDQVVVSVSDTGKGVDAGMRERLFDPFVSTRKQGLGIGLSLCKSVVDRHKGKVWLEDVPGPGATFCFSLPVHGVAESPPA
ncbi:MAG: GHKL domain-containing protein [Gammaproteobacteria bacterium]|jgi:signal transduction histidine kinase|nr:GHKL domain-containing protein [Gammaproteobacteria bacterium]